MKTSLIFVQLILVGTFSFTQQEKAKKVFVLEVKDALSNVNLHNFQLKIYTPYDTLAFQIDTLSNQSFEVDSLGNYELELFKEGFVVATVDWNFRETSESVYVTFFVPPIHLNFREKRRVHRNSKLLSDHCSNAQIPQGGFENTEKIKFNWMRLAFAQSCTNDTSTTIYMDLNLRFI